MTELPFGLGRFSVDPRVADLGEVFNSDNWLGAVLILGGLLVGAYGQAGRMPVITLFGIICVMAGTVEQFLTAAGQGEGVASRGGTVVAFIVVVLIGVFAVGAGSRRRDSALGGVVLAFGVVVLAAAAASLLLALLGVTGPLGSFD